MKILLIEDDIDVAASIAEYLEYHSIQVDFAYNTAQAKSRLQQMVFDLIVLDINLPDGNGIELCKELKQTNQLPQPILFLTARGALTDKLNAFESGAVDYMVKPFSMAELHARIKALNAHINTQQQFEINLGQLSLCVKTGIAQLNQQQIQLHGVGLTLLAALMRSHPKPLTSEYLCHLIWQDDIPKSNPLKSHISRINQQFADCFPHRLISSIRGIGYQLTAKLTHE